MEGGDVAGVSVIVREDTFGVGASKFNFVTGDGTGDGCSLIGSVASDGGIAIGE